MMRPDLSSLAECYSWSLHASVTSQISNKMKDMKGSPDGEAKRVMWDPNPLNLGILPSIVYLHWGRKLMSQTTRPHSWGEESAVLQVTFLI